MKKPVFITGMPGSGKTTIGKLLAYDLSVAFYDLDKLIEQHEKKTIPTIFSEKGEDHFRQIENNVLLDFMTNHAGEIYVMSLGGGTVCFFDSINKLKQAGIIIYIETSVEQLIKQLGNDTNRPLLRPNNEQELRLTLEALLEKRKPYYSKANFVVESNSDKRVTMADIVEIVGK